jgi:flagellar hook assembly protein FlgD
LEVKLTVFDYIGRRVRRLVNKTLNTGWHKAPWDGYNDSGKLVASGTYICKLRAGAFKKAIIMQLIK